MKIARWVLSSVVAVSAFGLATNVYAEKKADDKKSESAEGKKFKEGGCCDKAQKAGKTCEHKCCVAAAEKGGVCEKCNGEKKAKKDS